MFFLKKKNKHHFQDEIANAIAHFLIGIQLRFANYMNVRTARLTTKGKIAVLTFICIVFVVLSMVVIINEFQGKAMPINMPDKVIVPEHFKQNKTDSYRGAITEKEIIHLQGFKYFMDSLREVAPFKYDSIIRTRPHLFDSIHMLESIYYLQNK